MRFTEGADSRPKGDQDVRRLAKPPRRPDSDRRPFRFAPQRGTVVLDASWYADCRPPARMDERVPILFTSGYGWCDDGLQFESASVRALRGVGRRRGSERHLDLRSRKPNLERAPSEREPTRSR